MSAQHRNHSIFEARKSLLKSRIGQRHISLEMVTSSEAVTVYQLATYEHLWEQRIVFEEQAYNHIDIATREFWRAMRRQWLWVSGEAEEADLFYLPDSLWLQPPLTDPASSPLTK